MLQLSVWVANLPVIRHSGISIVLESANGHRGDPVPLRPPQDLFLSEPTLRRRWI